jgi:hypothetical protein
VPEGAWIVIDGTELYDKAAQKIIVPADTDFAIPVSAESAGSAYNFGSEILVRIIRVIMRLDNAPVGEERIASLGQDAQDGGASRERIKKRWRR